MYYPLYKYIHIYIYISLYTSQGVARRFDNRGCERSGRVDKFTVLGLILEHNAHNPCKIKEYKNNKQNPR